MTKQESTYNKETGQLTSFTEYQDGKLMYKHYYDERNDIIAFEKNFYKGECKWGEINGKKAVIFYKDTLGGYSELKPVKEGFIDVHIGGFISKNGIDYESIYNDLDTIDDKIEKYPIYYHQLTIKIFTDENLNKRILLIKAIKEHNQNKFILTEYVENINNSKRSSYNNNTAYDYFITTDEVYGKKVSQKDFIQNATLLHYLDEYNIELPND